MLPRLEQPTEEDVFKLRKEGPDQVKEGPDQVNLNVREMYLIVIWRKRIRVAESRAAKAFRWYGPFQLGEATSKGFWWRDTLVVVVHPRARRLHSIAPHLATSRTIDLARQLAGQQLHMKETSTRNDKKRGILILYYYNFLLLRVHANITV